MPGQTNTPTGDQRERMLTVAEVQTFMESGLVVHLRDIRIVEDGEAHEYMTLWVRNHGFAIMSKKTEQCYLLTDYGFLCLALGAGIDKTLDLILTREGEVVRGA
jgi:hypothetical protein